MIDIPMTIAKTFPGTEWGWGGAYVGEDVGKYELLDWRDAVQAKPTLAEIEAAWPDVEKALLAEQEKEAEVEAARTRLEATDTAALADTAPAKDLTEANAQLAVVRALLVDALVALGVAAPSKTADSAEKG